MKSKQLEVRTCRVVVLASGKGGVGKSTLARGLAGYWLTMGYRPAVVDADPQASVSSLHDEEGPMRGVQMQADPQMETIRETIGDLQSRHGVVVVDTAGFRNQTTIAACVAADVVVIP